MPSIRLFNEEQVKFIIENYETMTATEIGAALGFTKRQIDGKLAKLGLHNKRRKINDLYFKDIDCPDKAYLLGFIFADGYLVNGDAHYEFGIELQQQDRFIIDKLNAALGGNCAIEEKEPKDIVYKATGQIIHKNQSVKLRVYSKKLQESLIKNGIVYNKTHSNIFPRVDGELFFDWLRGYIDGDGCYYTDNGHTYMHITSCADGVLLYIKERLEEYGIKTQIYCENNTKFRLFCTSEEMMIRLVNRMYSKNCLCLTRKYEKIKHFLSLTAQ